MDKAAVIQPERLSLLWDEILPLMARHYDEIAGHKDIPMGPDVAQYKALEDAGMLRVFVASVDHQMVGYAIYIVGTALHYETSKQARQDLFFIVPEYRGTGLGARMVNYADDQLRAEGVALVIQHVKLAHPALGNLLIKRCGYEPVETIYAKRLDQ